MATDRAARAPGSPPFAVVEGGGRAGTPATAADAAVGAAIDRLETLYDFRDRDEVRAFLAANPDLLPLVAEAAAEIPRFLAPHGPLTLDVVRDPEEDDAVLVAAVAVDRRHGTVLPQLHRLIDEWLVDAARLAMGRFVVSPEYR